MSSPNPHEESPNPISVSKPEEQQIADNSAPSHIKQEILLKRPSHLHPQNVYIPPPPLAWLEGTWNVTYSTLPIWRKCKNVTIGYARLPPKKPNAVTSTGQLHLSDTIYNVKLPGSRWAPQSPMLGVDKPFDVYAKTADLKPHDANTPDEPASLGYVWRGKGLLRLMSSTWEILGYGYETSNNGERKEWLVTFFKKTLMTPNGIDVYVRQGQGHLSELTYNGIVENLNKLGDQIATLTSKDLRAVVWDEEAL